MRTRERCWFIRPPFGRASPERTIMVRLNATIPIWIVCVPLSGRKELCFGVEHSGNYLASEIARTLHREGGETECVSGVLSALSS